MDPQIYISTKVQFFLNTQKLISTKLKRVHSIRKVHLQIIHN